MYEDAIELDLPENAPRWCLVENYETGGLYWHFIDKNLNHMDFSCTTDGHKPRCGGRYFAVHHEAPLGHQVCPDCLAAMTPEEKGSYGV
jgi:hypothetical protein